jgi:hypothetical protein
LVIQSPARPFYFGTWVTAVTTPGRPSADKSPPTRGDGLRDMMDEREACGIAGSRRRHPRDPEIER